MADKFGFVGEKQTEKKRVPLGNFIKEYSVRNKSNEDIPVYSVTNSQGFCTEYFGKEIASKDKTTYKIVPRGYFAYNPSRINVGSVDWQKYEDRVIVSPLYNVFSVSDKLDHQYLYYFLRSNIGKQMIQGKASGSVRDNLKIDMLKELTIPSIPVYEQQFCSSILDKLQLLIQQKKKELSELDTLIKARFVEMFGDPIYNDKNWETDTVEQLCKEIYGGGTPSKLHPEYYEDGDIPWISSKDMKSDILTDSKIKINKLGVDNSSARMVPVNSVIMVIRSGILKHTLPVAINEVPITVNQDLKVFIPGEKVLSKFLAFQFKMHEKDILSKVRAVTADNIEFNSLKQRKMILPPIELQNEFAVFVQQIDKLRVVIQKSLDEAQYLFDSLMQEYFG